MERSGVRTGHFSDGGGGGEVTVRDWMGPRLGLGALERGRSVTVARLRTRFVKSWSDHCKTIF